MAISIIWFGKVYSWRRKWAVLPIICGVALAFYGDLSFTIVGATYTFLCVFLAALKAVVSGELLTGDLKVIDRRNRILHTIPCYIILCYTDVSFFLFYSLLLWQLHPIDLLSKMCPLALLQIGIISILSGEVQEIASKWSELALSAAPQVRSFSLLYLLLVADVTMTVAIGSFLLFS